MKIVVAGVFLGIALGASLMFGQENQSHPSRPPFDTLPTRTFYLKNASHPNDGNEIVTGLRLVLDPAVRLYLVPTHNEIVMRGTAEEISLAAKLITEWDIPKLVYRVTYTIVESDAGKRIGVEHYTMMLASGARTTLKQGSKVPVATGSYDQGKNGSQTQFTYLDVGMNLDTTLDEFSGGVQLKAKLERSAILEEKTMLGIAEPIVRQTVLEAVEQMPLNKPTNLGAIDISGSTRHLDFEATVELIK